MTSFQDCGLGEYNVTEIPHLTLTMKDGVKIALKLWVPTNKSQPSSKFIDTLSKWKFSEPKQIYKSNTEPSEPETVFPAILEFLPYNKDHWTGPRDYNRHPWFASHGYVCVRGDIRGSGTSTGLLLDEYLPSEQSDCIEIINWITAQTWSNGKVGMYGKSWGGFNGLQVAYEQPEALKAVVSAFSLDDRYADDIHYMGGCVLGNGMLSWSSEMFLWQANPPHPKFFDSIEAWKAEWKMRLEKSSKSFLSIWLSHQDRRDPYWCHGSIGEDISRVQCPILVIGGLADGYTNAAFRMGATLNDETRTVIGPWSHDWPDQAQPGPRIDFLNLCLNWWQYHLKEPSKANENVSEWPRLRLFMRESLPPETFYDSYPGYWLEIPDWNNLYQTYIDAQEGKHSLEDIPNLLMLSISQEQKLVLRNRDPTVTLDPVPLRSHGLQGDSAGEWCSWGGLDLPGDQQRANEQSYVWESKPLEEDLILAGFTMVKLVLKATKEAKYGLSVRLCEVLPTGQSNRITFAIKNLAQWKGQRNPETTVPANQELIVTIELNGASYVVPKGHRLALVVSPSYFPLMFTTPEPDGLILFPERTEIIMQTLSQEILRSKRTSFPPPLPRIEMEYETRRESKTNETKPFCKTGDGMLSCEMVADGGNRFYPHLDIGWGEKTKEEYKISESGTGGRASSQRQNELDFPDFKVISITRFKLVNYNLKLNTAVKTDSVLEDKGTYFKIHEKLEVKLNGEVFYQNEWIENVERIYA